MTKILFLFAFPVVMIAVIAVSTPIVSAQSLGSQSCSATIRAGWNLLGLAQMGCFMLQVNQNRGPIVNFPPYLDFYIHDGEKYIHARLSRSSVEKGDLGVSERVAADYMNSRVQKITNYQYTSYETYLSDAEAAIERNESARIDEYAKLSTQEAFKSMWVYNPGSAFSFTSVSRHGDEEAAVIMGINIALGAVGEIEFNALTAFLFQELIEPIQRSISRGSAMYSGLNRYITSLAKGEIALVPGWNFLTYSNRLPIYTGQNGTCSLTKSYVFDNASKKWVFTENADASMNGSGMVVYNAAGNCYAKVQGELAAKIANVFGSNSGGDNGPPTLPSF